jgi:hypothetical protein
MIGRMTYSILVTKSKSDDAFAPTSFFSFFLPTMALSDSGSVYADTEAFCTSFFQSKNKSSFFSSKV